MTKKCPYDSKFYWTERFSCSVPKRTPHVSPFFRHTAWLHEASSEDCCARRRQERQKPLKTSFAMALTRVVR